MTVEIYWLLRKSCRGPVYKGPACRTVTLVYPNRMKSQRPFRHYTNPVKTVIHSSFCKTTKTLKLRTLPLYKIKEKSRLFTYIVRLIKYFLYLHKEYQDLPSYMVPDPRCGPPPKEGLPLRRLRTAS